VGEIETLIKKTGFESVKMSELNKGQGIQNLKAFLSSDEGQEIDQYFYEEESDGDGTQYFDGKITSGDYTIEGEQSYFKLEILKALESIKGEDILGAISALTTNVYFVSSNFEKCTATSETFTNMKSQAAKIMKIYDDAAEISEEIKDSKAYLQIKPLLKYIVDTSNEDILKSKDDFLTFAEYFKENLLGIS